MDLDNCLSERSKEHGLIQFQQPVSLTQIQKLQAQGCKVLVTIDWGEFERQKWNELSPKIKSIRCQQLALRIIIRNNRYANLIKDIKHISFSNLLVMNLSSNKIYSLQQLPSFHMPLLSQIDLNCNFIISTRSFLKAHLPQLNIIRLQKNPLVDNSRIFQANCPKLQQFWFDSDSNMDYPYGKLIESDRITWRIKNRPKLMKENQINNRNYQNYHYRRYGYELEHGQVQKLTYTKYVEMLRHKPDYNQYQIIQQ